jgi:pimeloyl-ACP methyl ester carboxylesterase
MEGSSSLTVPEGSGRRLGWRTVGDGPPLLLVNGYAATAADWDPAFLAGLSGTRTVLLPDNRGMGASDPGDLTGMTVGSLAADLEVLLGHLAVDRLPVAGWSMGGMIAQELAARSPGRVSALVLLSTDAGGSSAVRAPASTWARLVDHSGSPRDQATRLLSLLFPPDVAPHIDRLFGEVVAEARAGLSTEVLDAQERALDAWHADGPGGPSPVPAVRPPVLVATGTEDQVVPPANARLVADRWGTDRVEAVEGSGHAVMAQEPVLLAAAVRDFVDAHP